MIRKAILIGILLWAMVTWVLFFAHILVDGYVTYIEPNIAILISELVGACLIPIGGIILIIRSKR